MAGQLLLTDYSAPWWLPEGHSQTIVPALWGRTFYSEQTVPQAYRRERWTAPDGDFIDVDFGLHAWQPHRGFLLLFHGLEGSSQSQYARALLRWCETQGLGFAVAHARGCSGEVNHAPRAYHSGDWEEIDWIVQRLKKQLATPQQVALPLYLVGVSLGGNALLRWAEESGEQARRSARAIAAICAPIDLAAGARMMDASWWHRSTYTRNFLQTMIPRAMQRLALHPGLFDAEKLRRARTFLNLTMYLPHRCTALQGRQIIGRVARPSRICRPCACPVCWCKRITTPSCPPTPCRAQRKLVPALPCGNRARAGMWVFRAVGAGLAR